jgi:hypothetical protein
MLVRRVAIIIIALTALAAGFQLLRSFGMVNLIKNVNSNFILAQPVSSELPENADFENYLIVYDSNEENSLMTSRQVEKALFYMKKDYQKADCSQEVADLNGFDCVFFIIERLDHVANLDGYMDYVKKGGSIAFLIRPVVDKSFEGIADFIGIKEYEKKAYNPLGLRFDSDVMLGAKDFKTDSNIIKNSSLKVKISNNAVLQIGSYDGNPLLWTCNYGNGRFTVFNGTLLNEKVNRGLFTAIASLAVTDLIYPVMNIKMVHIDDFASPIPAGKDEKIYEEFSRDISQFYSEIWWPDMIKAAKKYELKYSGFIIEEYDNITSPPFKIADSARVRSMMLYGRELLGIGGELGLHGYNHQSLAPQGYIIQDLGYKSWDSVQDMAASISELIRFIHSVFGEYKLRAYVPPSNILSPEGRQAVISANPELKIIASLYNPNFEGDVYAQEFEIAEDGIIEFPRITAGYEKNDEQLWNIYNGANLYGLFAHFVHPDDVLDVKRNNGKGWTELYKEFDSLLNVVDSKFSWLRGFTISQAAQELVKYLECTVKVVHSGNTIKIYAGNFRENIYCIMRTSKEIKSTDNCDFIKIAPDAYLLTLKKEKCSLEVN